MKPCITICYQHMAFASPALFIQHSHPKRAQEDNHKTSPVSLSPQWLENWSMNAWSVKKETSLGLTTSTFNGCLIFCD